MNRDMLKYIFDFKKPSRIIVSAVLLVVILSITVAISRACASGENGNAAADMNGEYSGAGADNAGEYINMTNFIPNNSWNVTDGITIRLIHDIYLVTDGAKTWSMQDAFPVGISKITVILESTADSIMMYGLEWSIERLDNNAWQRVSFKDGTGFNDVGLALGAHETNTLVLDLSLLEKPLTDGIYRIIGSTLTVWPTEEGYIYDNEAWTNYPRYQLEFLVLDVEIFDRESIETGIMGPGPAPKLTLDAAEIIALDIDYTIPIPIEPILNAQEGYEEYLALAIESVIESSSFEHSPFFGADGFYLSTVPIYHFNAFNNTVHNHVRLVLFSEDLNNAIEVVYFTANGELLWGLGYDFNEFLVLKEFPDERFIFLFNNGSSLLDSDNNQHQWYAPGYNNQPEIIGDYYHALNHRLLSVSYSMLTNPANLIWIDIAKE